MERGKILFELAAYDLDVSLYDGVSTDNLQTILNNLKRIHVEMTHKVDVAAAHEMLLVEGMLACTEGCGKIGADET